MFFEDGSFFVLSMKLATSQLAVLDLKEMVNSIMVYITVLPALLEYFLLKLI